MKLSNYIKNKKMLVGGALTKLIEVIFELMIPIVMGRMVNNVINSNSYLSGVGLLSLIFLFALLGYISTVISHRMIAKVSMGYSASLREALFIKFHELDLAETSKFSKTSILNRINTDTQQSANGLALALRIASRAPFLMLGSLIMLSLINLELMLILLAAIIVVIIITYFVARLSLKHYSNIQKEADNLGLIVTENINGARIVKSFVQDDAEGERFGNQNKIIKKEFSLLGYFSSLSTPLTAVSLNLVLVLMVVVSIAYIRSNQMDVENLIAIVNYTTSLIIAVIATLNLMVMYAKTRVSNERIREVLKIPVNRVGEASPEVLKRLEAPFKVEFINVSFQYPNHSEPVLSNLNFEIRSDEKLGIIGLTASGKSTLLKLIAGLIPPTSGTILFNGVNISDIDLKTLSKIVRYISQEASFLTNTVGNNILMGRDIDESRVIRSLEISNYPMNREQLKREIKANGRNFSGGQRQRMSIARGIIDEPKILLFDDTFSALDYKTDLLINKSLKSYMNKQIMVVVSQRVASLEDCDYILVLNNRTIESSGIHEDLLVKSPLYKKIYDYQQGEVVNKELGVILNV